MKSFSYYLHDIFSDKIHYFLFLLKLLDDISLLHADESCLKIRTDSSSSQASYNHLSPSTLEAHPSLATSMPNIKFFCVSSHPELSELICSWFGLEP